MGHCYHHALSSVKKWGGPAEDHLPVHQWFDESKAMAADFRHRALRHHAEGIFMLERFFGPTITISTGRVAPVRLIGEQHVREEPRLHPELRGLGALHPPRALDGPGPADPSRRRSLRRRRLITLPRQRNTTPGHRAGLSHFWRPDMADYFSPTVIQRPIPFADMTPLERLVLSLIFDAEPDGEAMYFHASLGPSDAIGLSIDALRAAFDASAGIDSTATTYIAARVAVASTGHTEIEIDFSGMSWEFVFQDIVRRSSTLRYVTAVTSFTCSKMRSDGFGGMAVLITADAIVDKSTNDILEDFLAQNERDAANDGVHVLLRIREDAVREQIGQAIETDSSLSRLTADAFNDADIHAACLAVVECSNLSEEQGAAEFRAALAAIHEAEQRLAPVG